MVLGALTLCDRLGTWVGSRKPPPQAQVPEALIAAKEGPWAWCEGQTLGWTREQVALAALHLQGGITQTRGRESDSGQEVAVKMFKIPGHFAHNEDNV